MKKKMTEVKSHPNVHVGKKSKEITLKMVLTNFAMNTTAHGFANTILYTNLVFKMFWVVAIIMCQVGLWSQIQPLVVTYYNKPIKSLVYLKQKSRMKFPMVTICNTNMIKKSMYEDLLLSNRFKGIKQNFNSTYDDKWYWEEDEEETFVQDVNDVKEKKNRFEIQQRFADMTLEKQDVFEYGYIFEESVAECKWRSIYNCLNKTRWRRFWHWKYGSCFSFNSGQNWRENQSKILHSSYPGLDGGLTLTLAVNRYEYHEMTKSAGIVLHIGEQGKAINLLNSGHHLAPGFVYHAKLREHETIRADPFRNNSCLQNKNTDLGIRSNGERIIKKYSTSMCYDVCVAKTMMERCNCTSFKVPSLSSNRTCTLDDLKCINHVEKNANDWKLSCLGDCRLPCHEQEYSLDVSALTYINHVEPPDMLKLHLYFETFETVVIEEKEFYKLENLLGDIGGQLGLWSGMSVLTCIEVVFFAAYSITLCVVIAKKRLHKQIVKKESQ